MPILQKKTGVEATRGISETHSLATKHGECGGCRGANAGRHWVSAVGSH